MNFEKLKDWKPMLLIGTPLLWLGFYLWAWMARVGCEGHPLGTCLVSAFGGWGADVVMLGWVDQTLGAGALAFGGGAFVYLAARMQRKAQIEDRNSEIRSLRLGQLRQAREILLALGDYVSPPVDPSPNLMSTGGVTPATTENIAQLIDGLRGVGPGITQFAPQLGQVIDGLTRRLHIEMERAFGISSSSDGRTRISRTMGYAYYAGVYLLNEFRLIDADGSYRHSPLPWGGPSDEIDRVIRVLFTTS